LPSRTSPPNSPAWPVALRFSLAFSFFSFFFPVDRRHSGPANMPACGRFALCAAQVKVPRAVADQQSHEVDVPWSAAGDVLSRTWPGERPFDFLSRRRPSSAVGHPTHLGGPPPTGRRARGPPPIPFSGQPAFRRLHRPRSYLYDERQNLRAGLEDHFLGNLARALPMGWRTCANTKPRRRRRPENSLSANNLPRCWLTASAATTSMACPWLRTNVNAQLPSPHLQLTPVTQCGGLFT